MQKYQISFFHIYTLPYKASIFFNENTHAGIPLLCEFFNPKIRVYQTIAATSICDMKLNNHNSAKETHIKINFPEIYCIKKVESTKALMQQKYKMW